MKPQSHTVKLGNHSAKVWRVSLRCGERWRYYNAERKQRTVKTLAEAKELARQALKERESQIISWVDLDLKIKRAITELLAVAESLDDLIAVTAWLDARKRSARASEVLGAFVETKKGEVDRIYLRGISNDLSSFLEHVGKETLVEVNAADITRWLDSKDVGAKRRKDLLSKVSSLFKWARTQGHLPDSLITEADKVAPIIVEERGIRFYSVEECEMLLSSVTTEFLPWLATGLFLGCRPEEIAPRRSRREGGILWEHFDWELGVLRLPAEITKGKKGKRKPRIVPINEAARDWLYPLRGAGRISPRNAGDAKELSRLGQLLPNGWIQDGPRHTYGTARNSIIRNFEQLSQEMGNSPSICRQHYASPESKDFGDRFFAIRNEN